MSQLKEQYERETGKCWHLNHQTYLLPAEGYVNWLEAKVENGSSHNNESKPCLCVTCSRLESKGGTCSPNTNSFVTECGGYSGTAHVS